MSIFFPPILNILPREPEKCRITQDILCRKKRLSLALLGVMQGRDTSLGAEETSKTVLRKFPRKSDVIYRLSFIFCILQTINTASAAAKSPVEQPQNCSTGLETALPISFLDIMTFIRSGIPHKSVHDENAYSPFIVLNSILRPPPLESFAPLRATARMVTNNRSRFFSFV